MCSGHRWGPRSKCVIRGTDERQGEGPGAQPQQDNWRYSCSSGQDRIGKALLVRQLHLWKSQPLEMLWAFPKWARSHVHQLCHQINCTWSQRERVTKAWIFLSELWMASCEDKLSGEKRWVHERTVQSPRLVSYKAVIAQEDCMRVQRDH